MAERGAAMGNLGTAGTVGAIRLDSGEYREDPPFDPGESYPELLWAPRSARRNPAYEGVRQLFQVLGYDSSNFGRREWNPLGWLVRPGDTVVLKPNMIKEYHPRDPDGWRYVLTHGSVVRAVADYVCRALEGRGRIVICDAPQTDSSFKAICKRLGFDQLVTFYREKGVRLDLVDLRQEEWESRKGAIVDRKKLPGDPEGSVAYDLGPFSEFVDHPGNGRYYGADYDEGPVNLHHSGGRHEYLVSRTVMNTDVFINLPKLKTHKKTGITVALKNLVGINADKNWLPHHTQGSPSIGGDEFPEMTALRSFERRALKPLRRLASVLPDVGGRLLGLGKAAARPVFGSSSNVVRAGNWHRNDTTWRMCLDLNRILFFGQPDGTLGAPRARHNRAYLAIVDGIVAGEGNGPLDPDPVGAGVILGGVNPVSVDAAAAVLMGFEPGKLALLVNAARNGDYPLSSCEWEQVSLISNVEQWRGPLAQIDPEACFRFRPHFGWAGHIERVPLSA